LAKTLTDNGVGVIVAGELGPGAKTMLEIGEIRMFRIAPGVKVSEAVEKTLKEFRPVPQSNV